jgi:FkbM family methyltransferase
MAMTVQQLVARDASREQIEDWCRARTQHYQAGEDRIVGRVLGKFLMCMHDRDISLTPHLVLDGIWEPWITMAIARHVQPGMRCMDVGACYGYYSLLMADIVGPEGAIEAWEPVWYEVATQNAEVNGLRNITVRDWLMGTTEDGEYRVTSWQREGADLFNAGNVEMIEFTDGTTSDDVALMVSPEAAPWDFIKIDVEGAEADVWKALAGVREVSPNLTVCMEFTPKNHPEPRQFLEQLHADGFTVGTVGHDGVPRPVTMEEALVPDTGGFRMLWLTRRQ